MDSQWFYLFVSTRGLFFAYRKCIGMYLRIGEERGGEGRLEESRGKQGERHK